MLTIGQLAGYTGVTVRAIRHYHQRGLLAEPAGDASGYRRYDGRDVVELIRIKTLAGAGVPLARISELLDAEPAEFAGAVAQIDEALTRRIGELTQHRRKLAELAGGERLFLPPEIVDLLDLLRGMGVSEQTVQIERDAWILMVALSPELIPEWVSTKRAALDDPEFRRIYVLGDQAFPGRRVAFVRFRPGAADFPPGDALDEHEHVGPVLQATIADTLLDTPLTEQLHGADPAAARLRMIGGGRTALDHDAVDPKTLQQQRHGQPGHQRGRLRHLAGQPGDGHGDRRHHRPVPQREQRPHPRGQPRQ